MSYKDEVILYMWQIGVKMSNYSQIENKKRKRKEKKGKNFIMLSFVITMTTSLKYLSYQF
jgi:hypothetical protein